METLLKDTEIIYKYIIEKIVDPTIIIVGHRLNNIYAIKCNSIVFYHFLFYIFNSMGGSVASKFTEKMCDD